MTQIEAGWPQGKWLQPKGQRHEGGVHNTHVQQKHRIPSNKDAEAHLRLLRVTLHEHQQLLYAHDGSHKKGASWSDEYEIMKLQSSSGKHFIIFHNILSLYEGATGKPTQ